MGIIGIGVDVVSIPRIAALARRKSPDRLAKRILSATEREAWLAIPQTDETKKVRFLAVRCVLIPGLLKYLLRDT